MRFAFPSKYKTFGFCFCFCSPALSLSLCRTPPRGLPDCIIINSDFFYKKLFIYLFTSKSTRKEAKSEKAPKAFQKAACSVQRVFL